MASRYIAFGINAYVVDKDGNQSLFLERVDTLTAGEEGLIPEIFLVSEKFLTAELKN